MAQESYNVRWLEANLKTVTLPRGLRTISALGLLSMDIVMNSLSLPYQKTCETWAAQEKEDKLNLSAQASTQKMIDESYIEAQLAEFRDQLG